MPKNTKKQKNNLLKLTKLEPYFGKRNKLFAGKDNNGKDLFADGFLISPFSEK